MNFFIVDDDDAIRSMLREIIEDNNLGNVVGEAKWDFNKKQSFEFQEYTCIDNRSFNAN